LPASRNAGTHVPCRIHVLKGRRYFVEQGGKPSALWGNRALRQARNLRQSRTSISPFRQAIAVVAPRPPRQPPVRSRSTPADRSCTSQKAVDDRLTFYVASCHPGDVTPENFGVDSTVRQQGSSSQAADQYRSWQRRNRPCRCSSRPEGINGTSPCDARNRFKTQRRASRRPKIEIAAQRSVIA
jgi:hypothetical protein